MDKDQLSELLGGWEGYTLGTIGRGPQNQQRGETPEIWIELHPDPQHPDPQRPDPPPQNPQSPPSRDAATS